MYFKAMRPNNIIRRVNIDRNKIFKDQDSRYLNIKKARGNALRFFLKVAVHRILLPGKMEEKRVLRSLSHKAASLTSEPLISLRGYE